MEQLSLTQEWDKTFPKSEKVDHSKVTFHNRYGITLAADLYVPKNAEGKLPAIAVSGPFGAVKEQSSGLYAQAMAERGFLTIAFDPSFTGESGGSPRYVASPDINTEDFSAAVDFLSVQDNVDPERIGIIGICGWGGMALNAAAKTAMQYALVGGECLLKPVPRDGAFDFAAIRRDCYVPLARDAHGSLLAVGTMERHSVDGRQYALLERRTAGADGLTIETRLFELNGQTLGRCVPLATLPACAELVPQLVLPGVQGVGLAVLKTPLMNCVDGSTDAVSIYAPAAGLLHALARCEEQLNAEFANGASRVFASEDLLRPDAQGRRALQDDLFVGLPDDPANVGVTVYSPTLREGSYLARKQDLLRGCESLLGLRRGILSEVETPAEPRTATEIAATSVDYDLTIRDLQSAWTDTVQQAMALCSALGAVYGLDGLPQTAAPAIDWGDGVLYDRARIWAEQRELVDAGLLRPELALAWYFDLPHETEAELAEIRRRFMGDAGRAQ